MKKQSHMQVYRVMGLATLVMLLVCLGAWACRREQQNIDMPPVEFADFSLPLDFDLSAETTYRGAVDVSGTWANIRDRSDMIEFFQDGKYAASRGLSLNGVYEVREGYVAILSDTGTSHVLRIVEGEGLDVLLQKDDDALPYVYRRLLPGEETDVEQEGSDEDTVRHFISAFKQILIKSEWVPTTEGVERLNIDTTTIELYSGGKIAAAWEYRLYVPEAGTVVPYDPPYLLCGALDGKEYSFELDTMPYELGYSLKIYGEAGPLLEAKSTKDIVVEEP